MRHDIIDEITNASDKLSFASYPNIISSKVRYKIECVQWNWWRTFPISVGQPERDVELPKSSSLRFLCVCEYYWEMRGKKTVQVNSYANNLKDYGKIIINSNNNKNGDIDDIDGIQNQYIIEAIAYKVRSNFK